MVVPRTMALLAILLLLAAPTALAHPDDVEVSEGEETERVGACTRHGGGYVIITDGFFVTHGDDPLLWTGVGVGFAGC